MDLLADARGVVENGPVCDACLGRVFAERSHGLTNPERGRALRTTLAMAADDPYDPVAPDDCWVCEGYSARYDEYAERAVDAVDAEFDTYQVGSRVPPLVEENERLLREDAGLDPDAGEPLGTDLNREVGKRVGRLTDTEVDFERPDVQFLVDLSADRVEATVNSAFVYGRYRKLERGIPQTRWPCSECDGTGHTGSGPCPVCDGSGLRYEESVEQLVAPVVEEVMDGVDALFHGAGREDVDARMLGTGRPFVVEVKEPRRRDVDVERLSADIDAFAGGKVEVDGLRLATHEMVERVKTLDASKTYRAVVEFDDDVAPADLAAALSDLRGATVEQYTPHRVDHRRAGMTRERTVYDADGELDDPRHATVELHGEGGLYVKELVSGDEGRTEPSLAGLLGVDARVTALDVLAVEGEDEPFEDEAYFR
ncbi:MAG: tRNA pseudouridine(54/55) synthase Pus10 [Haloferacaceae archaeon]